MKYILIVKIWLLQHTLVSSLSGGFTSSFELITRDECVCPGSIIVYECNVTRGESIVYEGSAFNCPNLNNELLFLHNDHNSNQSSIKSCNNGAIVARTNSNTQSDLSFSSRLTVTINDNVMALEEISCGIDNGLALMVIGSYNIPIITEPPASPTNITWEWIAGNITFTWSPIDSNCSNIYYNIQESGCGTCPDYSTMASITCSNTSYSTLHTCSISLQSVICGNISGMWSDPVYLSIMGEGNNEHISTRTIAAVIVTVIVSTSVFFLMGIGCALFVFLARRKRVQFKLSLSAPNLQLIVNTRKSKSKSASQVDYNPRPVEMQENIEPIYKNIELMTQNIA